jgi:uncharacterized lipoprotein YajG
MPIDQIAAFGAGSSGMNVQRSHRRSRAFSLTLSLAAGLFLCACASAPQGPLQLDLKYTPTGKLELQHLGNALATTPLRLGEITDARTENRDQVGICKEKEPPVAVLAGSDFVVALVKEALDKNFVEAGLKMSAEAETAIDIAIERFWVEETGLYHAEVRLRVSVMKAGEKTGEMLVGGQAKAWGATLNPENYRELLSNALIDAVVNLVNMNEFSQAVTGEAGGDTTPVAAPPAESESPASPSDGATSQTAAGR